MLDIVNTMIMLMKLCNYYELTIILCICLLVIQNQQWYFCLTCSHLSLLVPPCGSICLLPMHGFIHHFPTVWVRSYLDSLQDHLSLALCSDWAFWWFQNLHLNKTFGMNGKLVRDDVLTSNILSGDFSMTRVSLTWQQVSWVQWWWCQLRHQLTVSKLVKFMFVMMMLIWVDSLNVIGSPWMQWFSYLLVTLK